MSNDQPVTYHRGFDAAATDFDALGRHLWGPIGTALVAATQPSPGERVLDACCGTGASATPAADAVGPTGAVDAVDLSGAMIKVLDQAAAAIPQLRAQATNALEWPVGGYDVVQSALGIFFFPDMVAGTRRLIERARPGGRIGFTIWRGGAMEVPGEHLARAVNAVTGAAIPERRPHLIDRISNTKTYASWLGELGLTQIQVITDERRLPATDELAWLIIIGSGYRAAIVDRPEDQVRAIREHYLAGLRAEGVTEIDATTLIGTGAAPVI